MSKVIASTYEVLEEIGAGGGGVVYLGRHVRLNKMIVLKADKRSLSKNPESLRREVDALKNLSHTYIPQVYDFVQEDGIVYTVMDYIEGESLDKPLKRGEHFPQPRLVEWACELLEALDYLHSRPPYGILHSDIKPANIMITPQGDIRLIDFNIALWLGESGAVRVGRSRGYASPEHYGLDFSGPDSRARSGTDTERVDGGSTNSAHAPGASNSFSFRSSSSASGGKTVMLDKRSDIYSAGATLYHLFTGERPDPDAKQVKPITDFPVNPAIARIIRKAMEPNPDRRYQSAKDMLRDFERLHRDDPRAKRRRRHIWESVAAVLLIALAGAAMTYIGLRQTNRLKELQQFATDSRDALRDGEVTQAVRLALDALPENPGFYDPPERLAPARLALTNALGVYDLNARYQTWDRIELPSEPVKTRLTPDGSRAAVLLRDGADWKLQVFDLERRERIADLYAEASSQAEFLFADNNTLFYAGIDGLSSWDCASGAPLWPATGFPATAVALSPGGALLAAVGKDEQPQQYARFFDAATGTQARPPIGFGERRMRFAATDMVGEARSIHLFALDAAGRRLAVSFSDGSLTVFDLWNDAETRNREPTDYTHFDGAFLGRYLGYSLGQAGTKNMLFLIRDMESELATMVRMDGSNSPKPVYFIVQADAPSFYVVDADTVYEINMETYKAGELLSIESSGREIEGFHKAGDRMILWTSPDERNHNEYQVYNQYGQLLETGQASPAGGYIRRAAIGGPFLVAGNDSEPYLFVKKLENHDDALFFRYDPSYPHQEARMRSDGDAVVLFGSFEGSGFRICGADGSVVGEWTWDRDDAFDGQYRRPGSTDFLGKTVENELLEMKFLDGTVEGYSVWSGKLLYRERTEPVDTSQSLNVFTTPDYRVVSVNHGAPQIYRAGADELLRSVDDVTHLRYAVQVDNYLILQYGALTKTQELHKGLILDGNLEKIAEFSNLSDILPDGTLIFDDTFGNLRRSRIYSIQELMDKARN
ncbi:MAG: serine/threonine protein kinase [Oscillospiraceae bacterium]|nr:serine/threonine protein kinase [Oscillospiraceae bacterium]